MSASGVIYQCPACRALVVVATCIVEGERAGLRCMSCRVVSWLPAAGVRSTNLLSEKPATADESSVPGTQPGHSETRVLPAQPSDGPSVETPLWSAAYRPPPPVPSSTSVSSVPSASTAMVGWSAEQHGDVAERVAKVAPHSDAQGDLLREFRALFVNWSHAPAHRLLLQKASLAGELAFVGGCYRAVLDVVKQDPQAKAAQSELLTLAMASLPRDNDVESVAQASRMARGVLIAVVLLLTGATVLFLMKWMSTGDISSLLGAP